MSFLERNMKNGLIFLMSILFISTFVMAGENPVTNLDPAEIATNIATNLKDNLTSSNITNTQVELELPNFLKFINEISTVEELIIYVAFLVMIFILIYGIVEIFSNNKKVRGIISGSGTLLFAITGLLQQIMNLYLGVDLMNLNYKAISWKIIGIVLGIIVILSVIKIVLHKSEVKNEEESFWVKGLKLRSILKRDKIRDGVSY